MPVIYLDVLMALNLFIDFLLLLATQRILRLPHRRSRLVLGAILGSASSCLVLLDLSPFPSFLLKMAAACLIILAAFRWQSFWMYIKELAVFLIVSTAFAGIAFAVWFFIAPTGFYVVNGVVYYDVSPLTLTVLTVFSYFAISLYDHITHKKVPSNHDYRLLLDFGSGEVCLRALYDTGHHVTDVFTGSPVALVNRSAIEPYLPEDLCSAVTDTMKLNGQSAPETAAAVRSRLRMIPFQSVGGTGLLPAFRPKRACLISGLTSSASFQKRGKPQLCKFQQDVTGIFIAVCDGIGHGEYQAIIGTDIVSLLEGSQP